MWIMITAVAIAIVLFVEVAAILLQQRLGRDSRRSSEFADPQAQELPPAGHETHIYS